METQALEFVKARIGLSTSVRDSYLEQIIKGVISELKDVQGLSLEDDNPNHLMFLVDYSEYRYSNRDSHKGIPRHLQFRLHNLIISKVGDVNG